jgi:hypothetical protein
LQNKEALYSFQEQPALYTPGTSDRSLATKDIAKADDGVYLNNLAEIPAIFRLNRAAGYQEHIIVKKYATALILGN